MDEGRFDHLARQLGTRRTALGGLLAGMLLPLEAAARGKNKNKPLQRKKDKGKDKDRNKGNAKDKGQEQQRATAQAEGCWRSGACIPKKGANVSRCDLGGYSPTATLDCTGCNASRANLSGASLRGANFTRANLSGACLVDADFTSATFANNTNLANAIFCRTIMPDGQPNDSGCGLGAPCCPTCTSDTQCPANQRCVDGACRGCDVCANGCAHTSVQSAITAATAGGTIVICPGAYPTSATLDKNLTLIGFGMGENPGTATILDGGQANGVLLVNGGVSATIRALTVTRGLRNQGGGILSFGTLDLDRVLVTANKSLQGGGGIGSAGQLTLTDCLVSANGDTTAGAGGIYNAFTGSKVTLVRTIVERNVATGAGGIQNFQGIINLTDNSQVRNNRATEIAGGISNDGGTVSVSGGSTITGNIPDNCVNINGGTGCPP